MRAYLLAWDGKYFPLSFIKGSPRFVDFANEMPGRVENAFSNRI
jgi:hypothetical protein